MEFRRHRNKIQNLLKMLEIRYVVRRVYLFSLMKGPVTETIVAYFCIQWRLLTNSPFYLLLNAICGAFYSIQTSIYKYQQKIGFSFIFMGPLFIAAHKRSCNLCAVSIFRSINPITKCETFER